MADDAEPVEEELDPTKTDEEAADKVGEAALEGEPAKDADEQPKPGTPDKALQRLQQELGNVTRQLADLNAKQQQQDGGLSEADKGRLAKAQERINRIRQFVGRSEKSDVADEIVDPVAEHVLELTEKVGEQDRLKAELAAANQRLASLENYIGWDRARTKYAGLDVDAIWSKALGDAGDILGQEATPRAVNRLASKWFEERCDAAMKRAGYEKDKGKGADRPNNRESAPATYKVGSGQRTAPTLSDEDETLALARSLVIEE